MKGSHRKGTVLDPTSLNPLASPIRQENSDERRVEHLEVAAALARDRGLGDAKNEARKR